MNTFFGWTIHTKNIVALHWYILLWPSLSHGSLDKRLMHTAHLSGNTSGVLKSSSDWLNYTGFLWDVCVAFFNVPPGNKDAVTQNPPHERRQPSCLQLWTLTKLDAGVSKVCEIFKVHAEKNTFKSFTHRSVIVTAFPRSETWRWTKRTVIGWLTCQSNGLMGGAWPMDPFQTFSHQSKALATRDYLWPVKHLHKKKKKKNGSKCVFL